MSMKKNTRSTVYFLILLGQIIGVVAAVFALIAGGAR
jgi:hypothetical protein